MAKHWIAGAIKNPGALHKEMGVPEGKNIPVKKMMKAAHSTDSTLRRRAQLGLTLRKLKK